MIRTILVADDSVTIRRIVELTFADTRFRVESVGTGAEALERLETVRPDLVLADVMMPEPTGYEICTHVKRSSRPVPVVLLAGTFEPFDFARARACGADGHVVKPFDSRSLVELVEDILAHANRERDASGEESAEEEAEAVLDDLATESPTDADLPVRGAIAYPVDDVTEDSEDVPVSSPALQQPLSPDQLDEVVRAVVERMTDHVVREIAWDVVPDLAESIIRERLRQIERDES